MNQTFNQLDLGDDPKEVWPTFERDRYKIIDRESLQIIEPELREFEGFIDIGYSDCTVSFVKGTNTANLPEWVHWHLRWLDEDNGEHPITANVQYLITVFKCPFWLYLEALEWQLKRSKHLSAELATKIQDCERICDIDFVA